MLQRHGLYGVVEQICIHPREANQLHLYNVSIDGSKPNKMAIRLANTPTHEAIAQKVQAMNYIVAAHPAIMSMHFNWTTKIGNTNLIKKIAAMVSTINLNTDQRVEMTIDILTTHPMSLQKNYEIHGKEIPNVQPKNARIIHNLATLALEGHHSARPHGPSTPMQKAAILSKLQAPRLP